jgi:hypothetical protein
MYMWLCERERERVCVCVKLSCSIHWSLLLSLVFSCPVRAIGNRSAVAHSKAHRETRDARPAGVVGDLLGCVHEAAGTATGARTTDALLNGLVSLSLSLSRLVVILLSL